MIECEVLEETHVWCGLLHEALQLNQWFCWHQPRPNTAVVDYRVSKLLKIQFALVCYIIFQCIKGVAKGWQVKVAR